MGNLIKPENGGLVSLLHSTNGEIVIPKPFEQEIFLFDTYVAGTTHVENIDVLEPGLDKGVRLDFFREPNNKYDSRAIVIKTQGGEKIG